MYRTRIGQVVSAASAQDRLYAMFERSGSEEGSGKLVCANPATARHAAGAHGRGGPLFGTDAPDQRPSEVWRR
jgi:hypothetical protein